jgi:adenylate cyclase
VVKKSAKESSPAAEKTRRQVERLSLELPISVRGAGRGARRVERTRTVDISRGGISFHGRQSYRPGMKVRVSFLEAENLFAKRAEIPARVVRVSTPKSDPAPIVAVRFADAAVANLVLSELLRAKMRVCSALLETIQPLRPGAQIEEVTEAICRTAEKAMEAERALLFLRDPAKGVYRARVREGGVAREFELQPKQGLAGQALASGRVVNVASLEKDRRFRPGVEPYFHPQTRSVLCVPLSEAEGPSPGLLVVLNKHYGTFSAEDEALGRAVGHQISAVLREARLFEDISNVRNYNESVLQSISAGVTTFDSAGRLVKANRAAVDLFALDPEADAGKHFSSLLFQDTNPRLTSLLEDALARQRRRSAYDIRLARSDGANLSLNVTALPLQDAKANLLGAVLVAEDITQEQRLTNTLCRYVAREVAELILQDVEKLKLGGTRTEVTILFADIRGFTAISERMDPEGVVSLLNTYYPRMINVIFRHQGMVDKFIGDAILAVFGVPVPRDNDALRAVQAALEIRRQILAINRERQRKNEPTIEIGIGITSGTVISGNIGSERRMDYTVIGDPVNLAARLEGLTKELERKILVNDSVRAAIEKEIPCEPLGVFKVRGKQEEVPVFAVKTPD